MNSQKQPLTSQSRQMPSTATSHQIQVANASKQVNKQHNQPTPSTAVGVKRSSVQQNLSQSSTPKGAAAQQNKKVIISTTSTAMPSAGQAQYQQPRMQQAAMLTAQQQQQMLFENRKRSAETQFYQQQMPPGSAIHSKSTKVSPTRTSSNNMVKTGVSSGSGIVVQSQKQAYALQQSAGAPPFEGVRPQQLQHSMDNQNANPTSFRSGQKVPGMAGSMNVNQGNALQFYNFDMEGIPPQLISHTAGSQIPIKSSSLVGGKKDINPSIVTHQHQIQGGNPQIIGQGNALNYVGHQIHNHQASEDLNMDSSMHQSFINLIYPSKSKKLMSSENNQQVVQMMQQSSKDANSGSFCNSSGPQPGHYHHQKSKSHFVGGTNHIVQNFVKPIAHQLAPKGVNNGGVQKIQQSQYKKQSSIFNYSQRFKELLNETIGEDPQQMPLNSQTASQGPLHKSHAFSQQHSPSAIAHHGYTQGLPNHPNHIMVNFNDIQLQQQRASVVSNQQSYQQQVMNAHQKGTFDKPLVSQSHQPTLPNQYLSLSDQAALLSSGINNGLMMRQENNNKTIDYTQPSINPFMRASQGTITSGGAVLHNTPNTNTTQKSGSGGTIVVMSSKSKVLAEPQTLASNKQTLLMNGTPAGSLHQRKPSHPVTNNFMLELLSGPPSQVNNPAHHNHVNHQLASSFAAGQNKQSQLHQIDLSGLMDQQNNATLAASARPHTNHTHDQQMRQQQQQPQFSQYQQLQPIREKKQHQPTQSKNKNASVSSSNGQNMAATHHQRSQSDYTQSQQYHHELQQNQLLKFLNSESYDAAQHRMIQQQYMQQDHHLGVGPEMIESFENLDCTTITHSGQVNLGQGGLDSNRMLGASGNGSTNSFAQQAFSQMLYADNGASSMSSSAQLSHRQLQQQMLNQQYMNAVQGVINNGQQQQQNANNSSSLIYRKMSLQQQPSNQLQIKKSPSKEMNQVVDTKNSANTVNYQKIATKRKSSPSTILQQQTIAQGQHINTGQPAIQQQQQVQPKTSATTKSNSTVAANKQHQVVASGSLRTSQVSSPTSKNQQHQQQTVNQPHHHTSSSTSINQQQLPNPQQFNQQQPNYHHNRSNSDLMKQQIMLAQAAAMKQQGRPNPSINSVTPLTGAAASKAKSELTTPRTMQQQQMQMQQHQPKVQPKKTSGTAGSTPANVSIDLVTNTNNKGQTTSQQASQRLTKNTSNHNISQHAKTGDHTPRLKQQSPPTSKNKPAPPQAVPFQASVKRYSVQNSPRAKQQSSQPQYNLSQQYQMFQQVMAKQQQQQHNKTETVSPQNSKGSFNKPNGNNVRVAASSHNTINPSKSGVIKGGEEDSQVIKANHRRGVSETEYLLNQIRNNINTLKAYQPYPGATPPEIPSQQIAYQGNVKASGGGLQRITEASSEQLAKAAGAIEPTQEFPSHSVKMALLKNVEPPKYKRDNLMLQGEDTAGSYQNLTTDPNLSPYSKDLFKLQKLIKFNFRKYNEPPVTTSEFYRIGRVLGRGAFGKVNLAAHKLSEQLVAIKSINKEFLRSSKHKQNAANADQNQNPQQQQVAGNGEINLEHPERRKVMQEFAILKQSNHQSVVRLYDTFETNKHICFVMELCAGGDLLTYVRKRRKLAEDVAKYFFKQLIEGLAYLHHSKLIVHRDIKLDNILLDANGRIKIADFGVSRQVRDEAERMTEQCGTPAYIAPEILRDKGYEGFKVDVWSAGVCLYAMLIGTVPFKAASMQELHHLIINGKFDVNNPNANCQKEGTAQPQPQQQTKLSEHAVNLIHSLLQVDPKKRLSAIEVLSHPWLKDCKEELDVFTQKEKDVIRKEYLSKNIDRVPSALQSDTVETEVIFTEHNLDTKTNVGSLLKNASTKSIILAPFNSTVSEVIVEGEPYHWPEEVRRLVLPKRVLKFAPKVKDLDRQYEHNNNADLDNGVYNNIGNEDDPAAKDNSEDNDDSADSLKRSFKETSLSSDDEHAEQQLDEARKRKQQQSEELQEFEKQLQRLKYARYQEPVEVIDVELVGRICTAGSILGSSGVYPRDYLLKALQCKEMNYATACYHLLLKKQQLLQKHMMHLCEGAGEQDQQQY